MEHSKYKWKVYSVLNYIKTDNTSSEKNVKLSQEDASHYRKKKKAKKEKKQQKENLIKTL